MGLKLVDRVIYIIASVVVEIKDHAQQVRVKQRIIAAIGAAIPQNGQEYRVTVTVRPGNHVDDEPTIEAQAELLPEIDFHQGVNVQLSHQLLRSNPSIKSCTWKDERKALEQLKRSDCSDVVMVDEKGTILEGTTCNFGVITGDGIILTAPEGTVLTGTIMKLVEQLASIHLKKKFQWQAPQENHLSAYQAAFITSTSRLILPVDQIYCDNGTVISYSSSQNPILRYLQKLIWDAIRQRSTLFR